MLHGKDAVLKPCQLPLPSCYVVDAVIVSVMVGAIVVGTIGVSMGRAVLGMADVVSAVAAIGCGLFV